MNDSPSIVTCYMCDKLPQTCIKEGVEYLYCCSKIEYPKSDWNQCNEHLKIVKSVFDILFQPPA